MNTKQWVQHISGQGEKWEIREDMTDERTWYCIMPVGPHYLRLPKSEYCSCDPPEEWEDVTEHCELGRYDKDTPTLVNHMWAVDRSNYSINAFFDLGYRLRKVRQPVGVYPQWALIIERRKA